jgi:hypothetical protein
MPEHLAQVLNVDPIVVDIAALRQARADRALERESIEIEDFSSKLESLKEFAVLSAFARRKN